MILFAVSVALFCGCGVEENNNIVASDYLRIHIRANSNNEEDQDVKYLVKDDIVEYLAPIISDCSDKGSMIDVVNENIANLESVANDILEENGFEYKSKVYIHEEYFPTRVYGDTVLEADVYDAIIVELGEASGNNWWCVVYPPLCFAAPSGQNIVYKSKILEIIRKFRDKNG